MQTCECPAVLYSLNVSLFHPEGKYYIATMTMITASTSLTIFIMNIHFCGAEAKPVPHWAKVLIIDYMSKIFFVYEVGENCTTPESERTPLYPEEPMGDKGCYHDDSFHNGLYHHDSDQYKYINGQAVHHHTKHYKSHTNGNANGGYHYYNNHNKRASTLERGNLKQEPTRHYHHIRRDQLDYEAPPHLRNLQHLNGGFKEQNLFMPEKIQLPSCPCCCPCPQHKQVTQPSAFYVEGFITLLQQFALTFLCFLSGGAKHPVHCQLLPRAESHLCKGSRVEESRQGDG